VAAAIADIESRGSGGFTAVGPQTKYGRAYGKYQVLATNVPDWTQEATGERMTPQQFLNDKQAQKLTARLQIQQLLAHHKPVTIAAIWLTGTADPPAHWQDVYGTTAKEYQDKFLTHYD
jgi:hypothetical protein